MTMPALAPAAANPMTRPAPKSKLARAPAKQAPGHLSLEDTISVSAALVALRIGFTIIHIETTGPDPLRDDILSIHALQVDSSRPVAEFNAKALPLRALASQVEDDDQSGRPPAKRPGVPLQEAIAGLCRFLDTHRQHVFVHGAAHTQTFLGQAARQYGLVIENQVGDLIDLAKLAWPDRADYSLAGLAADLLPGPCPVQKASDITKAILALLRESSKGMTADDGLVSRSIGHWSRSPDTFRFVPSPW